MSRGRWRVRRGEALIWAGLLSLGIAALGGALMASMGTFRSISQTEGIAQVCWQMMSQIIESASRIPSEFSLGTLVGTFLLGSFGIAGLRTFFCWKKTQRLMASAGCIETTQSENAFLRSIVKGHPGLQGIDVRLIDSTDAVAFTSGALRPRVYVSSGLLYLLTEEEILSVLLHEASHVKRKDPLRWLGVDLLAFGLWFLPLSWSFKRNFVEICERVADERAVETGVSPLDLASALVKVASARSSIAIPASTGFVEGNASLSRRIEHLLGQQDPGARLSATSRTVWVSVAIGLALIAVSQMTVPVGGFAKERGDAIASFGRMTQPCMLRMSGRIS